jgi:hypothetical protein
MSNEVQKFDPSQLMDGVRDRIKATFVSLIPDERWEAMVQRVADDFFKQKNWQDRNREIKSDFEKVAYECLTSLACNKITEYLQTFQNGQWIEAMNASKANEELEKVLIKIAPELFASTFSAMFNKAIEVVKRGY